MIPKRIDRKPEVRDDYGNLARYIAAAKEEGEKLDRFWIVNCDAGQSLDDLELALIEIDATRTLASPKVADKTYHLVLSFRHGEQDKLSLEDLQDIERHFAEALGYGEHQRVAGTHINTDNFHMHIAFNKVDPVTHRVHTPRRDFATLSKVARAMERKYGLQVDKGMEARNPLSAKARDYEAKTWQQSFERHLVEHRAGILAVVAGAGNWRQVHEGLADFDTVLKKRGAGLAFVRAGGGKGAMKASALDRSCALKALEERLGPFVPAPQREGPERPAPRRPKRPYLARPLTRHPAAERLWRTWRQEKRPGFLGRHVLNLGSWRDYLLADAHRDPLALAIIVSYKEFLHTIEEALTPRRAPTRAPKSVGPALETWFAGAAWKPPAIAGLRRGDLGDMDLKADDAGRVLFPLRDDAGHVWAVRALDAEGRTCDIGDVAARPGLRHVIDPAGHLGAGAGTGERYAGPIVLSADGLAAVAAHKGTDRPAVIVGREQDLAAAVRELRARHPDNPILVAATAGSRAVEQAAKRAGTAPLILDRVQVVTGWVADQAARGRPVAVDPAVAEAMGAFVEDALSPEEARPGGRPKGKTPEKGPGKGDGGLGR